MNFFYFCIKGGGKLGRFDFHYDLKWYLRDVTKAEVVEDDPQSDNI